MTRTKAELIKFIEDTYEEDGRIATLIWTRKDILGLAKKAGGSITHDEADEFAEQLFNTIESAAALFIDDDSLIGRMVMFTRSKRSTKQ